MFSASGVDLLSTLLKSNSFTVLLLNAARTLELYTLYIQTNPSKLDISQLSSSRGAARGEAACGEVRGASTGHQ